MDMPEMGKVFLVGAGPGDDGLLTVKGRRLLESAEVVVYDRLVGEDILALMPEEAEKINVGKVAGYHPVPQGEINRILADKAKEGKRVVRLKGGDSFVFGRGGEELELLKENHVPFEVVPGITSAIAAAAYAGIPVTHRDFCSSLHIITGHKRENGTLRLDYDALVRLDGTLLFLMSVSNIEEIAAGLLSAGMGADMPCALVENGTRPEQRKLITRLETAAQDVQREGIHSPALFIVGRVCSLSDSFDWFDNLPLKGVKVLVTRPRASAHKLADGLKELGAAVTLAPAIETRPLPFAWPDLAACTALVFTSAAGVSAFFGRLFDNGQDARCLAGKRLFCVGKETARSLREYGLRADYVPAVYSGERLAQELIEKRLVSGSDRLLLLRAREASRELPGRLKEAGVPFDETAVYETVILPLGDIDPRAYDMLTFTSASCVEGFAQAAAGRDLTDLPALCIGEQTARAAKVRGMQAMVPPEATIDSMIKWMEEWQHGRNE